MSPLTPPQGFLVIPVKKSYLNGTHNDDELICDFYKMDLRYMQQSSPYKKVPNTVGDIAFNTCERIQKGYIPLFMTKEVWNRVQHKVLLEPKVENLKH